MIITVGDMVMMIIMVVGGDGEEGDMVLHHIEVTHVVGVHLGVGTIIAIAGNTEYNSLFKLEDFVSVESNMGNVSSIVIG